MHTDLHPAESSLAPRTCQKRRAPASSNRGRLPGESRLSTASLQAQLRTRCAQRDAVAAEAERTLLPPDDAVSCLEPRTTAQSTAPSVQCPEPRTSSATPNAMTSAVLCTLLCPSLPCAPTPALHCLATTSSASCTVVHRPHPRLALRSPPTRFSQPLASLPPAPPSLSSGSGEAPSLRWPLGLQWRLLFAKSFRMPSTEYLWNRWQETGIF